MTDKTPTPIAALRAHLDLSQTAFGERIGGLSKGNVSVIEREGRCSFNIALAIEELGRTHDFPIDAADLNDDVRRARTSADQVAGVGAGALA